MSNSKEGQEIWLSSVFEGKQREIIRATNVEVVTEHDSASSSGSICSHRMLHWGGLLVTADGRISSFPKWKTVPAIFLCGHRSCSVRMVIDVSVHVLLVK